MQLQIKASVMFLLTEPGSKDKGQNKDICAGIHVGEKGQGGVLCD